MPDQRDRPVWPTDSSTAYIRRVGESSDPTTAVVARPKADAPESGTKNARMTRWSPIIVAVIAAVATVVAGLIGVLGKSSPPNATVESVSDTIGPDGQRLIEVTGKVTSLDPDHQLYVVAQPSGKQLWYVSAPVMCDTAGLCHGELRVPPGESPGLGIHMAPLNADGGVHQHGDNFVTTHSPIDAGSSPSVWTDVSAQRPNVSPPAMGSSTQRGIIAPSSGAERHPRKPMSLPSDGNRTVAPPSPDEHRPGLTSPPTVPPSTPVLPTAAAPSP